MSKDHRVVLSKASPEGADMESNMSSMIVFQCGKDWARKSTACSVGDEVDVKILSVPEDGTESKYPQTGVRYLKATIEAFNFDNGTIHVNWLPGEENEQLPAESEVEASFTFHMGIPCDSESGAYIEELLEPQQCSSELVVHVAALCADPDFVPPMVHDSNPISCKSDDGGEVKLHRPDEVVTADSAQDADVSEHEQPAQGEAAASEQDEVVKQPAHVEL